jgi:hypothetical protein
MHRYATALRSKDRSQRRSALRELCRLGSGIPVSVLDSVVVLLQDSDEVIRESAAQILLQLGQTEGAGHIRVLQILGDLLVHPQDLMKMRAVGLINKIGPPAAPLAPALISALKDTNRIFCRVAAEALCRLGPDAIPALQLARTNSDPNIRNAAEWALSRMDGNTDSKADTVVENKAPTSPSIKVSPNDTSPRSPGVKTVIRTEADRRETPRFLCNRDVFYQVLSLKGEELWWKAKIHDVSAGGVGMMLDVPLKTSARISIDLSEAHQGIERKAVARIIFCRQLPGGYFTGCAWLGTLTQEELNLLCEPATAV